MTIQHQNNRRLALLEQTKSDHTLHPASQPKKLSVANPLIYLHILIGVIFLPESLKRYRKRLNVTEKLHLQKQAMRVASTVLWVPLLAIFITIWASGLVKLHSETAGFMIGLCLFSCYSTYKYGLTSSIENKNNLMLSSMFSIFGLVATLFYGIFQGGETGQAAIFLSLIILIFALIALCVAMVFKLQTIDMLSGFVALFIIGGIAITMSQVMSSIWLPVIIILVLILGVGITEERHQLNNHQQHQAQP